MLGPIQHINRHTSKLGSLFLSFSKILKHRVLICILTECKWLVLQLSAALTGTQNVLILLIRKSGVGQRFFPLVSIQLMVGKSSNSVVPVVVLLLAISSTWYT